MKKIIILIVMLVLGMQTISFCAEARIIGKSSGRLIYSNACVLAYTDVTGRISRVIRGNPVIVYLNQ